MPEKGWKQVNIRKLTAEEIKSRARSEGLTFDEFVMKAIKRADRTYEECPVCKQKVPKEDFNFHLNQHVKEKPELFVIRKRGKCSGCGGQELDITYKNDHAKRKRRVHSEELKKEKPY